MSDTAAAFSHKIADPVLSPAVLRRAQQSQGKAEASAIDGNPIFKIMLAPDTTPEQKRDAVAQFLTFAGTKEESRTRIKAYQEFEEFMQAERERMAQEIIKLTDTEAYSELQAVYNDLNNALIDFDEKMKPLVEITDALYVLRTNDKVIDAFQEIRSDRNAEAEKKRLNDAKEAEFSRLSMAIRNINGDIAALGEKKSFFGFGNVTQAARQEIARKEQDMTQAKADLDKLAGELADLEKRGPGASSIGEFAEQKAKLRELLDISSDEHKRRQEALVSSALNFVETAKSRIGSVRSHLGQMSGQIDNLYDANGRMSGVYAVLTDGIKNAAVENQTIRSALQPPESEESLIAKMTREEKETAVNEHISTLMAAGSHTTETYADLAGQTIRIKTMRDSTQNQIDKARVLGTQGVASVADRLSVVLQAVSAAALGESSTMAKDTLAAMVDSTNKIAQKETIRVAMGVSEANNDVLKAIDDLGAFGEVLRTSTQITHQGLTDIQANLAKIKALAEDVRGNVRDAVAVSANVQEGGVASSSKEPSPFGIGR